MDSLRLEVSNYGIDIICIAETWFNSNSGNAEINGYKLYRCDRETSRGGGVCVYVKDTILSSESQLIEAYESFEAIWLDIKVENERLLVGCVYRSPSCPLDSGADFRSCFGCIDKARKDNVIDGLLIIGDFNFPTIQWDETGAAHICRTEEEADYDVAKSDSLFVDAVYDNYFHQFLHIPTFQMEPGVTTSVLDLVLSESDIFYLPP